MLSRISGYPAVSGFVITIHGLTEGTDHLFYIGPAALTPFNLYGIHPCLDELRQDPEDIKGFRVLYGMMKLARHLIMVSPLTRCGVCRLLCRGVLIEQYAVGEYLKCPFIPFSKVNEFRVRACPIGINRLTGDIGREKALPFGVNTEKS